MSLITGINTFIRRSTFVYSTRIQTRLFTDESPNQQDTIQEPTRETNTTGASLDPKFLVRNFVKMRDGSFRYPTSSMVHLLGRVLGDVKQLELTRGRTKDSYNCFSLLTGHTYPDGSACTQKHRVIVPKSCTRAYNNSNMMRRDNIAQISGDISYRFYFEPQIQLYVPYTEFIANHLTFFMNQSTRDDRQYRTETGTGTGTGTEREELLDEQVMEEGKGISFEEK